MRAEDEETGEEYGREELERIRWRILDCCAKIDSNPPERESLGDRVDRLVKAGKLPDRTGRFIRILTNARNDAVYRNRHHTGVEAQELSLALKAFTLWARSQGLENDEPPRQESPRSPVSLADAVVRGGESAPQRHPADPPPHAPHVSGAEASARQQASFHEGKARISRETFGEAHALAAYYGDERAAAAVHYAIAACIPTAGYALKSYACSYSAHYGGYADRRWPAERAKLLDSRLHALAQKAMARRSEIESIHARCLADAKGSAGRATALARFQQEIRKLLDEF